MNSKTRDSDEFADEQELAPSDLTRREFLSWSAAALSASSFALSGCSRAPNEKIVPYRVQAAELIPGQPLHYASASTLDGYATGILVESHEGRPTKIEGNAEHPASLGASSAYEQALLIELYDPARLRALSHLDALASNSALTAALTASAPPARGGRGLHLLMPPQSSPLLEQQLTRLRERLPELTLHFHAPLTRRAAWRGAELLFGAPLEARFDLRRARVIAAFGADFLAAGAAHLAHARAFADGRRMTSPSDPMNRLYVVESSMTPSGAMADHRLALRPSEMPAVIAALLAEVAQRAGTTAAPTSLVTALTESRAATSPYRAFVSALAGDLLQHRGESVLLVGDEQLPVVHAAAHALNALLGNQATTCSYATSPIIASGGPEHDSLGSLRDALLRGEVDTLLILDTNLADNSAAELELAQLLGRARQSFYLTQFRDRTAAGCQWLIPRAHVLESWGDTCAFDGTRSLVQPLIAPLYGGRTESEIFACLLGEPRSAHELLRAFWRSEGRSDAEWEEALTRGIVSGTTTQASPTPELHWDWLPQLARTLPERSGLELVLRRDPRLYDGRFADNPWLLELPCPITKQSWGNAAQISPALATELGIANGDELQLEANGRSLRVPALVVAGQADRSLTLTFGWGRGGTSLGAGHGANAYALLSANGSAHAMLELARSGEREALAMTQDSQDPGESQDQIVVLATLEEYRKRGEIGKEQRRKQLSLYTSDAAQAERQWGMTIDLNACTGCSACVIACQAENSIPSVGKSGVLKRREMHWLRIDRYLVQGARGQRAVVQPMACQHCEQAPCEYVCPTAATVHSSDGLNQMIYNRCVGTRFCSNNCPYKVRRFNWFNYHSAERSPSELAHNPQVTVRERGVMEKCTYCVQRIRRAEIRARTSGAPLPNNAIQTACEQACPTRAIRFGDIARPDSDVAGLRRSTRAFSVLNELGTRPRTLYLAKLENPNPELA